MLIQDTNGKGLKSLIPQYILIRKQYRLEKWIIHVFFFIFINNINKLINVNINLWIDNEQFIIWMLQKNGGLNSIWVQTLKFNNSAKLQNKIVWIQNNNFCTFFMSIWWFYAHTDIIWRQIMSKNFQKVELSTILLKPPFIHMLLGSRDSIKKRFK